MKKYLAAVVLLLSMALMLSGCFPSGEKDPNLSSLTKLTDNRLFEHNANNLTVSFEIPEIPSNLPMRIRLKGKHFDTEEMIELFFDGKIIDDEQTWSGNYYTYDGSRLYVSTDYSSLSFNDGETAHGHNYQVDGPVNYQVAFFVDEKFYKNTYFSGGNELENFPLQNALDRVLKLTSTLGITDLGEPEIYAVSLDTYAKLKVDYTSFFNEEYPLTTYSEMYILHFPQVFDGIELADLKEVSVNDYTLDDGKSMVWSPRVTVGVAKDRIFYFDVSEPFEAEYEVVNSQPAKYDLNYVLSELISYLDKTYFSKETVINNVKAVYYPVERRGNEYVEYSLAWSFEGYVNEGKLFNIFDNIHNYKVIVSAENGVRTTCSG